MKIPEVWECPECGRLFDSESVCMPSGTRTVLRERGGEVVSAVLNRNRYRGHPPEVVHGLALELGDDGSVVAHRPGMEPVQVGEPRADPIWTCPDCGHHWWNRTDCPRCAELRARGICFRCGGTRKVPDGGLPSDGWVPCPSCTPPDPESERP